MGGLSKKHTSAALPEQHVDENTKLTCPFCAKEFVAEELLFAVKTENAVVPPDEVYQKFLQETFLPTGKDSQRRMKFLRNWTPADVVYWDVKDVIPLIVKGIFEAPAQSSANNSVGSSNSALGLNDSNFLDNSPIVTPISPPVPQTPQEEPLLSEYRLCPHCHCELPQGLGIYKKVVIGLYGGSRSGKTTYMTIVTQKLLNELDSLGLGTATLMAECYDVLRVLYTETCKDKGNDATHLDPEKKKFPFPIGITIEPTDKTFTPFFLIFQDIPGEATEVGKDNLVNHPFTKADTFLGVMDVNMFLRTADSEKLREIKGHKEQLEKALKQQSNTLLSPEELEKMKQELNAKLAAEQPEFNRLMLSICDKTRTEVFGDPKCAQYLHRLRSVQIMLTKMDYWKDQDTVAEDKKELEYCTELLVDHTKVHKNKINDLHLRYVDKQVRALLTLVSGDDVAASFDNTCLESLAKKMPKDNAIKYKAFTAVTSKLKPVTTATSKPQLSEAMAGSEYTYKEGENVLDPIFNICKWENLLPVDWS